jgi:phage tail-like protein
MSDPYKNFKFRVRMGVRYVAGFSKVSGLTRTTAVVDHREGGDTPQRRKPLGQREKEPITLERGVTHDADFEAWANRVSDEASQTNFKKDVAIDVFDEAGQKVLTYAVVGAWVSEYQGIPDLDADANAVAIQHITLENEGWRRSG